MRAMPPPSRPAARLMESFDDPSTELPSGSFEDPSTELPSGSFEDLSTDLPSAVTSGSTRPDLRPEPPSSFGNPFGSSFGISVLG